MSQSEIKDSGERREFDTGAVRDRDPSSVKGRYDLLPHGTLFQLHGHAMPFLAYESLARHFEAGANKYDARNWEKGMPVHEYVNSGCRHLAREAYGLKDEPHLDALVWNLTCMLWTIDRINDGDLPSELWTFPFDIQDIQYEEPYGIEPVQITLEGIYCNLACYFDTGSTGYFVTATRMSFDLLNLREKKNGFRGT